MINIRKSGFAFLSGLLFFVLINAQFAHAQSRTAFVHLFEWSWNDIAQECEQHLGPKGFAAVQVSPPQRSINRSEWWSRYQPVSYAIEGRGGSREEFRSMVERCAAVGVDIYADAIINHMAAFNRSFPEVPYGPNDFHTCQTEINYGNRFSVQNCDLVGLNDLRTETEYVRNRIADYMNDLIGLGVKGFRIDAAKHIPAQDIAAILARLNEDVYIFQEVIGAPGEAVQPQEYIGNADVTEFNFERTMGFYFKGRGPLRDLRTLNTFNGWLNSSDAVVFVSNHDDQRQKPDQTLTYKDSNGVYELGEIFALSYPYGYPKVMSSYFFEGENQGPPSRGPNTGDACGQGWVCEHRWQGIANMVGFRNATIGEFRVTDWWDNGNNQIAFGRGGLGFVAINRENNQSLIRTLQTGMPQGTYCDVVNADFNAGNGSCNGATIDVDGQGFATFNVPAIKASAIHVNARVTGEPNLIDAPLWENAFFRGTANSWAASAMSFSDGLWRTTQTFSESANARFKIDRFGDWRESYPAQDVLVTQGSGDYSITINDRTLEITVIKIDDAIELPVGNDVDVTFNCRNGITQLGQGVYVIGNIPELGAWNPANAVALSPNNYPLWSGVLSLPANSEVSWKCLKRSESNSAQGIEWEGGNNNRFDTNQPSTQSSGF